MKNKGFWNVYRLEWNQICGPGSWEFKVVRFKKDGSRGNLNLYYMDKTVDKTKIIFIEDFSNS